MDNAHNPLLVFDDVAPEVLGVADYAPRRSIIGLAASVIRRARSRRLRVPVSVVGLEGASTRTGFTILGADDSDKTGLPLFDGLHARFIAAIPAPKLVRLDDQSSYDDFRKQRRQPYLDLLSKRVAALEAAFAAHVEDDADDHDDLQDDIDDLVDRLDQHVSDGPSRLEKAGDAVIGAVAAAAQGGKHVALPLPSWAQGKVSCWQDGPEVLCTVKINGLDGRPRYATSAAPIAPVASTVLGCAMDEDAEIEEIFGIGPAVTQRLCGEQALVDLCGVAEQLVQRAGGGNFVGAIVPQADPKMAAGMALVQRCQRGDRRAQAEALRLHDLQGDFIGEAAARLVAGQALKGARR